jgi:Na+/proline symporter
MIAVFLAAYMSTISSQLNWGTSYIINDFYKRFVRPDAPESHYVLISRIAIVFLTIFSLLITKFFLTTVSGAWEFIINASAGMGAVLILRWYWHRINAWSEISAMIAPLIIYPIARYGFGMESPITLYPIVLGTTIVWLVVTFITKPTDEKKLETFYRKIHPGGWGWKPYAAKYPDVKQDSGYGYMFVQWFFGVVMVYTTLYAVGQLIFKEYTNGLIALAIGIISAFVLYYGFKKSHSLLE